MEHVPGWLNPANPLTCCPTCWLAYFRSATTPKWTGAIFGRHMTAAAELPSFAGLTTGLARGETSAPVGAVVCSLYAHQVGQRRPALPALERVSASRWVVQRLTSWRRKNSLSWQSYWLVMIQLWDHNHDHPESRSSLVIIICFRASFVPIVKLFYYWFQCHDGLYSNFESLSVSYV